MVRKSVPFATIALCAARKIPLAPETLVGTGFGRTGMLVCFARVPAPGSLEACGFIPVVAVVIAGKAVLLTGLPWAMFPMVPLLPASEIFAPRAPALAVETFPVPATARTGLVTGFVMGRVIVPFAFLVSVNPGFCAGSELVLPGLAPAQSPARLLRIVVAALEALVVLLCRGHGFPVCLQQKTPESVG